MNDVGISQWHPRFTSLSLGGRVLFAKKRAVFQLLFFFISISNRLLLPSCRGDGAGGKGEGELALSALDHYLLHLLAVVSGNDGQR